MLRSDLRPVSAADATAAIDAWLGSMASPNTRAAYRADITAFTAWCAQVQRSPLRADRPTLEAYRAHVEASGAGPATVSRRVSAVNGFTRFSIGTAADPRPDAATTTGPSSPTVPLTDDERAALLDRLGGDDRRAAALVALLLLDGLKLDEVLRLDAHDVSGRPPVMHAIVRRGAAQRTVLLHPDSAVVVAALVRRATGPVLTTDSRSRVAGQRLTRFGADYLLKQAGRAAGLAAPLTANSLRRTHVVHAHRQGRSVDEIRRQVGHDDVRTTRRYLGEEAAAQGAATPSQPQPAGGTGSGRRPDTRR